MMGGGLMQLTVNTVNKTGKISSRVGWLLAKYTPIQSTITCEYAQPQLYFVELAEIDLNGEPNGEFWFGMGSLSGDAIMVDRISSGDGFLEGTVKLRMIEASQLGTDDLTMSFTDGLDNDAMQTVMAAQYSRPL